MTLFYQFKQWFSKWRRELYWNRWRRIQYVRTQLSVDQRWMASDPVVAALTERYLAMLSDDWYNIPHEETAMLRSRLELVPEGAYDPGYHGAYVAHVSRERSVLLQKRYNQELLPHEQKRLDELDAELSIVAPTVSQAQWDHLNRIEDQVKESQRQSAERRAHLEGTLGA